MDSLTSPTLRNAENPTPHPILSSTLIPRDYLGSRARSPRSPAGTIILESKTASSSPAQSPTCSTFPPHADDQTSRRERGSHDRPNPAFTLAANGGRQTENKNAKSKAEDISVAKIRNGVSSPETTGATSSSSVSSTQSVSQSAAAVMPRTSSIDSAISSISGTSTAQKATDHKEPSALEIRNLIATAGSAENLVQHLLRDKANAASQNAQLWKLVDKQRTLLLGLNKDLERVSKEKDRYRKKAKDLAAAHNSQPIDRHVSQSHSPPRTPPTDELPIQMTESNDGQDAQSETTNSRGLHSPYEPGMIPSPLHTHPAGPVSSERPQTRTMPPVVTVATDLGAPNFAITLPTPVTASPSSFSSKRQIAPKPLDLRCSKEDSALARLAAEQAVSDAEMENIPTHERGRRKTREEDDRDRELMALEQEQQEETRSRSKKEKRPQQGSSDTASKLLPAADISALSRTTTSPKQQPSIVMSHSVKDGHMLSPPIRSPGLPSSPRPMPADRSMSSPEGQSSLNSLPMSPRNGGFALSPRAPKAPIPMPLNAQIVQPEAPAAATVIPPRTESLITAINEPTMTLSSDVPTIYRGLVDPHLPNLLLPPNAIPSIQVRVASSRLRPSRFSLLGMKPQEDTSVFSLSVFSRSNNKELWRIEKVPGALPHLDQQIRPRCPQLPRLPDRKLFAGHSPATLDARRNAIDQYFDDLLDTHIDEQSALLICKFLSTDVLDSGSETKQSNTVDTLKQPPPGSHKKNGYLTKKGKNFGGWKSRYFVLDSADLRYFEAPGGAHLGTIKLRHARIGRQTSNDAAHTDDPESESQYRHAFLILEPKRKDSNSYVRHVLCAENDSERDDWETALLYYIEDPSKPSASGSDTGNPRALLRGTDYADGQADAAAKASSPTLGPTNSGSASPASSVTPPLEQGPNELPARNQAGASLGIPLNPRAGNRQSAVSQPQQKIRNLFQFRKSSHEALNGALRDNRSPHPPQSARARTEYIRPVFGLPLIEAVESCPPEGVDVELPAVVYRSIEYLRGKKAANEEGLFRLSGSNIVIRTLKERFNTEGDVDLLAEEEYYDVHAVASLFKTYLRELPATILTRDLHLEFLKVLELQSKAEKITAFNVLVHRLPRANFVLLRALSEYLLEVVQNQDRNKMTVKNVGIVFAPTLNIPAPVFSMFLTEFDPIFNQANQHDDFLVDTGIINEPPQSEIRSPRRQMFTDVSTPAYNHSSFAENAALRPQGAQAGYEPNHTAPPFNRSQSYENRGYVSIPNQHAPPQPMYPPPPQPHQQTHGGYRVVAPDNTTASTKQKRRESAMLLF